ncbi:hypothetical protein CB0940_04667 [Cercospora beticola]|uniref:Uncharacterized protein n=1 Tax=Cercospora beticola TaxID=122368 RepID=A0A2G5HNZ6_CERBT|nr:hypothetical protein CB0940_04667 [Cercospora beticola]PIA93922.1 hypothetical protein CB0940_04667 [Cercospora beticola]WPB01927.1 hypothetical protein RHO25_006560 [Cercospora beticola]CAK1363227.1 unnamed protein product [Cercospora beticola]
MLSTLANFFKFTRRRTYPSTILVLGNPIESRFTYILHIIPEIGKVEMLRTNMRIKSALYCAGRTKEISREHLGSVALHKRDGNHPRYFLDEVSSWAIRDLKEHMPSASEEEITQLTDQAFRPIVRHFLEQKKGCDIPKNAAQGYSIYQIQVNRPKPGRILPLKKLLKLAD